MRRERAFCKVLVVALCVGSGAMLVASARAVAERGEATFAEEKVDVLALAKTLRATSYKSHVYPATDWWKRQPETTRPPTVDCTQFVDAVVQDAFKQLKKDYTKEISQRVKLANFSEEEKKQTNMNKLVEAARKGENPDPRLGGVQFALVDAKLGDPVASITNGKPGDLVQYWYKSGSDWLGHAAIVSDVSEIGIRLYGAHRTSLESEKAVDVEDRKGGVGESIPIPLQDKTRYLVYVVRLKPA